MRPLYKTTLTSILCLSAHLLAQENTTAYVTDWQNGVVWTFPQSGPFPDNSPSPSITGFKIYMASPSLPMDHQFM